MNLVCLPRLVLGRGVKGPLHSSAATRVRPGVLSVFSFSPDENFFCFWSLPWILLFLVSVYVAGCVSVKKMSPYVAWKTVHIKSWKVRGRAARLNLCYCIYQDLHCGDCITKTIVKEQQIWRLWEYNVIKINLQIICSAFCDFVCMTWGHFCFEIFVFWNILKI